MDVMDQAEAERLASLVGLAEALAHAQELRSGASGAAGAAGDAADAGDALFEALEAAERRLFAHKAAFGVHCALFQRGCEEFVLLASAAGLLALGGEAPGSVPQLADRPDALAPALGDGERQRRGGELLARAEQHTRRSGYLCGVPSERHASHRRALRLTALNNLACFHRRGGRPWAAIGFLERALRLQLKLQTRPGVGKYVRDEGREDATPRTREALGGAHAVALTRLNLAAVLSQLERHAAAVEHAKTAVGELLRASDRFEGPAETKNAHLCEEEDAAPTDESHAELLVVAFYNLAVELEHTSDRVQAQAAFQRALDVAKQHPALLGMDLVAAIQRILHEYAAATRPVGVSPRAAPARGQRTPRGHEAAEIGGSLPRKLSPRSLRQLQGT